MGFGLGEAFAAFAGGAAERGAEIAKTQREYDMKEAAKAADLERQENFAKYNYDIQAPQRNIENEMNSRRIAATEQNAATNKLNVDSEISARESNIARNKRQDALQAQRYKVNDSQMSGEFGKDEKGNVKQLTKGELASGNYKLLDTREKAKYMNDIKSDVDNDALMKKLYTKKANMINGGVDPKDADKAVELALQYGIDDPAKALELWRSMPGLKPTEVAQAKSMADAARENNETIKWIDNGKAYTKKAMDVPIDKLIKIMAAKTMRTGKKELPSQAAARQAAAAQAPAAAPAEAIPTGKQPPKPGEPSRGGGIGDMFAPFNPNKWPTIGQ